MSDAMTEQQALDALARHFDWPEYADVLGNVLLADLNKAGFERHQLEGLSHITREDWLKRCHEIAFPSEIRGKGRAGGLKFDADKPRMELLIQGMPRALEAVGVVLTFGAEKYAAHSWKHVEDNENRYWAAKSRHELARAKGEARDPETGLLHLAHEACNALFLLELAMVAEELERE